MLEDLSVTNFTLIDSVSLEFEKGLNILSGETGAGKSILIGSLNFLLGSKVGPDSIRTGTDEARVSGSIFIEPEKKMARTWLSDKGIEIDNDRVLLRRTLRSSGKSGIWIQDTAVTRTELAEFTSFLVDMHGQHDHQSLLKVEEHRRFLDAYAGLEDEVASFTAQYSALAAKKKMRDEMNTSEKMRKEKAEILSFALEEIQKACLLPNEEETLEAEEQRLSQHEKLYAFIDQISISLSGEEGTVQSLKKTRSSIESAAEIDASLSSTLGRIENSYYELQDIAESMRQYRDSLSFDPARLELVEERLSLIYKLKKKYGSTINDILVYAEEGSKQLDQLSLWESNKNLIDAEITNLEKAVFNAGSALSKKRKIASEPLQKNVENILKTLGMSGTSFRVQLGMKEGSDTMQRSGPYGFDTIEFMISANPGEALKPLAKIASGGELSRVMLAFKTVLADADESGTLIFDEIDTGIGGEVALSVGNHLKELSGRKQILCITHLASIAVQADNQIKIEKSTESGKTITRAFAVTGPKRVEEIARMLAGDGFSSASMQHAEELLSKYAT